MGASWRDLPKNLLKALNFWQMMGLWAHLLALGWLLWLADRV